MLNLIEEKVGNDFELIATGDDYLNRIPIKHTLTINKWDLMKLKSFCKTKDTGSRISGMNVHLLMELQTCAAIMEINMEIP